MAYHQNWNKLIRSVLTSCFWIWQVIQNVSSLGNVSGTKKNKHLPGTKRHLSAASSARNSRVLLFIASDNLGIFPSNAVDVASLSDSWISNLFVTYHLASATQMNEIIDWADTVISPHGCHIEMDTSLECSELTLGNWWEGEWISETHRPKPLSIYLSLPVSLSPS